MNDRRSSTDDTRMQPVQVHPWVARMLVISSLAAVLAVPAWRQLATTHPSLDDLRAELASSTESSTPDVGLQQALAWNHTLQRGIEWIETGLEDSSPVLQTALPTVQWILLRFGGIGNETVYAGPRRGTDPSRESPLILRKGFDHLVGPPFLDPKVLERRRRSQPSGRAPLEPDPRPALLDLHRRLQARNIELIFMPVPTHGAIHPAALGSGSSGPLRNPSLGPLLDDLRRAGIHVFDPSELLSRIAGASDSEAYLSTDSHWSPTAIDTVAEALAARIHGLVSLPPADRDWTRAPFERRGRGDLWQALKLPADRPLYAEEKVRVHEVTTWDGRLWTAKRGAPVLLLGDSFSTVYSDPALHWGRAAGLAEQLAYHLLLDVDRIARPDGSSDQVRRDLARQSERLHEAKVVVYQVATRELSFGHWPVIPLP